ncbi:MAG: hypothetical protein EB084_10190 [Proteobacteria bacterium]|nr:hypothetical protein [Pseudomonadota bacterium]
MERVSGRRNVAVIGCGLMGRRRAEHVAADGRFVLRTVVDTDGDRARALADRHGCAAAREPWQGLYEHRRTCDTMRQGSDGGAES